MKHSDINVDSALSLFQQFIHTHIPTKPPFKKINFSTALKYQPYTSRPAVLRCVKCEKERCLDCKKRVLDQLRDIKRKKQNQRSAQKDKELEPSCKKLKYFNLKSLRKRSGPKIIKTTRLLNIGHLSNSESLNSLISIVPCQAKTISKFKINRARDGGSWLCRRQPKRGKKQSILEGWLDQFNQIL